MDLETIDHKSQVFTPLSCNTFSLLGWSWKELCFCLWEKQSKCDWLYPDCCIWCISFSTSLHESVWLIKLVLYRKSRSRLQIRILAILGSSLTWLFDVTRVRSRIKSRLIPHRVNQSSPHLFPPLASGVSVVFGSLFKSNHTALIFLSRPRPLKSCFSEYSLAPGQKAYSVPVDVWTVL